MSTNNQIPTKYRTYTLRPGKGERKGYGTDSLKLSEVSTKPELLAGDVLVKVHAVSLNHRDLDVSLGEYGGGITYKLPESLVPCSDAAGEVVAVGARVKEWAPGQRVCVNSTLDHVDGEHTAAKRESELGGPFTNGILAEYRVVPAHSLVELPEYLSYEEGATFPCAALTAYNALYSARPLKAGDILLVQGTGGVSIFGIQIGVAAGATVIATSSSDEKLQIAKKLGAQHIINYKTHKNWEEEVLKITKGEGVDHVLEVCGMTTLHQSLKAIRTGGTISVIGYVAGHDRPQLGLDWLMIFKAALIHAIRMGSVSQFKDMIRLFTANHTRPVIDKIFSFEEASDAFKYIASQKHVGKVVIKVTKD